MGNLTDDMTRLRGEIEALRGARGALISGLTRGAKDLTTAVAAMRADFTCTHAAMANKSRGERETFVASVINEVNSLLGAFSRDRNDMARKGRHDRGVFLSDLRTHVMGMCKETADDLVEARRAWRGAGPGKSPPVSMKEDRGIVKPIPPLMEAALKKTVAAPEFKMKKSPAAFVEPLKKKEEKKRGLASETRVVNRSQVKAPPSVGASGPSFQKRQEKGRPDEKPAETMTKAKRDRRQ